MCGMSCSDGVGAGYLLSEKRRPKADPRVTAFYDARPLNALYISVVSIAEIRFGIELQYDVTRRAEFFSTRIGSEDTRHEYNE